VDLAYHLVAFAALMLPSAFLDPAGLKLSFPAGITRGALIEILQPLVGRNASGLDLIADVVGLAVGFSIGTVLRWMLLARDD
jgi:VanZ family protein